MTGRKVDLAGAQWVVLLCSSVFGIVPGPNDDGAGELCVRGWQKNERKVNIKTTENHVIVLTC